MSEVKRYNPELEKDIGLGLPCLSMMGNPYGEWVKWEDYAALKAERDALASENVALKGFGDTLSEMHAGLEGSGTGFSGEHEAACQQMALDSAMDEFDAIKTPATDAYLNSLRANGADAVAAYHKERADALLDVDRTGANEHKVSYMAARDVAAQLRAGEPS